MLKLNCSVLDVQKLENYEKTVIWITNFEI